MKLHLHLHPHEIKKAYYRRAVAFLMVVAFAAHFMLPQHETWISLLANLVWLFDPTDA